MEWYMVWYAGCSCFSCTYGKRINLIRLVYNSFSFFSFYFSLSCSCSLTHLLSPSLPLFTFFFHFLHSFRYLNQFPAPLKAHTQYIIHIDIDTSNSIQSLYYFIYAVCVCVHVQCPCVSCTQYTYFQNNHHQMNYVNVGTIDIDISDMESIEQTVLYIRHMLIITNGVVC